MRLELTKRADYAIRAALALGEAGPDERLSVRRIAAEQSIPARFLPRVMADLVAAGLVEGMAGRSGGYRLARPAADISLLDLIEAVEGDSLRRVCVLRGGPCRLNGVCAVHEVFAAAQEDMIRRFRSATVAASAAHRGSPGELHTARALERDEVAVDPNGPAQVDHLDREWPSDSRAGPRATRAS